MNLLNSGGSSKQKKGTLVSLNAYLHDVFSSQASDLEGEINLMKCYNVSEYQVQRNYGFQIHTPKGVFTLSAMTAGIRKNWIQALMKNVHPANAPDVASLPGQHIPCSPPEVLPKPDVTQDSPSADVSSESEPHHKASSVTERRREGRYKTFDWAEFKPESEPAVDADPQKSPCSLELGDLERRKRREERRRRYEKMLGFSLLEKDGGVRALSPKSQQRMEEEMEECWKQVEKTMFRLERTVPLFPDGRDAEEMEKVLQSYRKNEDLKAKLSNLEQQRTSKMNAGCQTDEIYLQDAELQGVTCERGLASMEESHLKVVEELQRRHKQEVERLLVDRDRLLEEESTATATAIEAIKNAHRLELQREVQRRCEFENSNGLSNLEEVHRQHSEELASCQRELEVLSHQFSLKCLENGHLVQALDAERKALCQCQQENQDLRTRNQELSGHLAAEITRLCTLAKQDALPLSQGMDVYEMEVSLADKRNATKKYKDMYTELSIVRAKAEREADELRENLRLAHQALGRTSAVAPFLKAAAARRATAALMSSSSCPLRRSRSCAALSCRTA
uniref:Myosin phosphatase Rho interacting protein n=1 Tax=Neolamprologus brichardi TaxID=32507 RepID=A0A3Q4H3G7_NEOBR